MQKSLQSANTGGVKIVVNQGFYSGTVFAVV